MNQIIIKDIKPRGVPGGTVFSGNAFRTRDLNSINDNCYGVTIKDNQIKFSKSLRAYFTVRLSINKINESMVQIREITRMENLYIEAFNCKNKSYIEFNTFLEIKKGDILEVQQIFSNRRATDGMGKPSMFFKNTYCEIAIKPRTE